MPSPTLLAAVERVVASRRLLDHHYYRRWQEGSLNLGDLSGYAEQYRHFEKALVEVLAEAASAMDNETARVLTESNLADELTSPAPHVDLFEGFAAAVGAGAQSDPTCATVRLVDLYRQASATGPVAALAVIAGYEAQAAEIAATKADALRDHYDLTSEQTKFWDIHASMETNHASWTVEALEALQADPDLVGAWAKRSADAWWDFLDEREATTS